MFIVFIYFKGNAWFKKKKRNTMFMHSVAQSCLTLCDPMGCSLPGSSALGIFRKKRKKKDSTKMYNRKNKTQERKKKDMILAGESIIQVAFVLVRSVVSVCFENALVFLVSALPLDGGSLYTCLWTVFPGPLVKHVFLMYKFRLFRNQFPIRQQLLGHWNDLLPEPGTAEGHLPPPGLLGWCSSIHCWGFWACFCGPLTLSALLHSLPRHVTSHESFACCKLAMENQERAVCLTAHPLFSLSVGLKQL